MLDTARGKAINRVVGELIRRRERPLNVEVDVWLVHRALGTVKDLRIRLFPTRKPCRQSGVPVSFPVSDALALSTEGKHSTSDPAAVRGAPGTRP